MSGKRRKHTPEFREQAAHPVIETGRPWCMSQLRSVSANKCWVVGCAWPAQPMMPGILARCLMLMSAQSWNVCAARMPNCVWTVSF